MDHSSDEEINVFGDSSDDDLLVSNEPQQALQVDGHADFRDLLSGQTNRELCKSIEGAQIRFIRSERKTADNGYKMYQKAVVDVLEQVEIFCTLK
uniref:Uncharacterized protein n=1 Tax=Ditylenchus dipsaci TaxID=166011 RepID=A0A915EPU5_9BILA